MMELNLRILKRGRTFSMAFRPHVSIMFGTVATTTLYNVLCLDLQFLQPFMRPHYVHSVGYITREQIQGMEQVVEEQIR